jgi:Leucine-rich repeat (LRR) protein
LSIDDLCQVTDEGLVGLTNMKKLRLLNFDMNRNITNFGLKLMTNVTQLGLRNNLYLTDDGISQLTNLKILYLHTSQITNGMKNLVNLTSLSLHIDTDQIENDVLSNLSNLKTLDISGNNSITDIGLKNLTNLTSLKSNGNITSDSVKYLTNLKELNLENNFLVSNLGIKNLFNLQHLNILNNKKITDEGISLLTNLTSINMKCCLSITNIGIKNLSNITQLNISQCPCITDEGIIGLTKLRKLVVTYKNKITVDCIKQLSNLKHKMKILTFINSNNGYEIEKLWKIIIHQIDFIEAVKMINVSKTLCRLVYYNMESLEPYTKYIQEKQQLLNDNNRMIFKSDIIIQILPKFAKLRKLDLSQNNSILYNNINNDGLKLLTSLYSLNLDNNQIITNDSVRYLRKLDF